MTLRFFATGAVVSLGLTFLGLADTYRPPNLEKKAFTLEELHIDKISKASLLRGLLSTARDFDKAKGIDYKLRAHALSIAHHLKPNSETIEDLLEQLQNRGTTAANDNVSKLGTMRSLSRGIKGLMKKKEHPANQICARYCIDIALRFGPKSKEAPKLQTLKGELGKPNWNGFLKRLKRQSVPYRKPWKRRPPQPILCSSSISDGQAKKPAAMRRETTGLSHIRTNCFRHVGSTYQLVTEATASKNSELLKITTKNEVNPCFKPALQKVTQLLKTRHKNSKRIPGGYEITITIEGSQPHDTSVTLPLAVALDSMLTGTEIDPQTALTGKVSGDGKISPVKNLVHKILAAQQEGKKLIAFPAENTHALADLYLAYGLEPLLKIQCLSFETFEQGLQIAHSEKKESLQKAMSDYQALVLEIEGKEVEALQSDDIQTRLSQIIDIAPEHRSAHFLLQLARDEAPEQMSIAGTNSLLEFLTTGLIIRYGDITGDLSFIPEKNEAEEAKKAYAILKSLDENKLNEHFKNHYDDLISAGEVFIEIIEDGIMYQAVPPRRRKDREAERKAGKITDKIKALRKKRKKCAQRLKKELNEVFESHRKIFRNSEVADIL